MQPLHSNENLLGKMLVQMTGEELVAIVRMAATVGQDGSSASAEPTRYIYGVQNLASYIGCCASTIYDLKKRGVLDSAIKSQIGKRIVFDGDKARELAEAYQQEQRLARRMQEE